MSPHWSFRSFKSSVPAVFGRWFRSPTTQRFRRSLARRPQRARLFLEALEDRVTPTFSLGAAANYAILFEAGGGSNLHIANGSTNTVGSGPSQGNGIGNIGVGASGSVQVSNGTVNGNVDFANTSNYSGTPPTAGHTVNSNVNAVPAALSTVNGLNSTLGGLPGTNVAINGNTTINASNGTLSASGPGYTNVRVFNVSSFSLGKGQTLTINGDANGDSVVLNFRNDTSFDGGIVLNGLAPDNVIFNFVGGNNLNGGPVLGFNSGKSDLAQGIFLDPNGSVSSQGCNIFGRLFGGDTDDIQFNADSNITAPLATPTLTTTPNPATVTLGPSTVTLHDSATLSGSNSATGSINFTLFFNGGSTSVHTESVTVNGDGTYTTKTGYTLAGTSQVTGTYEWVATYSGDSRNHRVKDINPVSEQVTVSPASPTLVTSQQPAIATVGASIADKATVTGYHPTGTVTFNLYDNPIGTGTPLFTDANVTLVNGAAMSRGYTATATGTDYWVATYSGDGNNNPVTSGTALEPVVIGPATPAIMTTQKPASATVGSTIADQATVTGGFKPTGTVEFNLFNNPNGTGAPLFTDTEPLANGVATSSGDTASVTGTYYWVASYGGDANNNAVTSGTALEPVVIHKATPAINTSPQPATASVGSAIADKAAVTGGFNPSGSVTFNLYANPNGTGTPLFTDTDVPLVNGMATSASYTATASGTDYWVATYNGDGNNNLVTSGTALEPVVIGKATPAIDTTQQPPSASVGSSIADEATVTGGFNPTGTVTFKLYANPNGTGTPLFTDPNVPLVNGMATSTSYTTTATGTDFWVATYHGDGNNNLVTSGTALEPVVISKAAPAIDTSQQPASATVGSSIADQATVTGGFNPHGTVEFDLYDNPNGTGTPLFTDTQVLVNGVATSAGYTTTATGTDYWVARYNGDNNNNAVTSGTAVEPVTISPATPAINTSPQPATATVGSTIADQAAVTGGFNPTGTVTFNLYDNPNGTGTSLFTDTEPLVDGVATSAGYTTTATGTDYWVATYNGDSNNSPVTSGTALEPVTITPATPAINTSPQPATATVGSAIADQATVGGGFNPTGTVTFNLYDNPNGTGTPLFTDANVLLVNDEATSAGYTTTATGTDYWVATYNGDSNNSPVTSGTTLEPVTITPATPAITTTQMPASATVGTGIADQAAVTGGFSPTGTVTFKLYNNPNGAGTPLFINTQPLSGGMATSQAYIATATGTDYWVAAYNGDSNNSPVTSDTALEPVIITAATPAINTTPHPTTATVGSAIADQATVGGGFNPTGTVTFNLYDNPNGTGTPLFTDADVPLVNDEATSAGYTATATGTNYWVATYNGDSNNSPVTSGTALEPVVITPTGPTLAIHTSPQPDTATVGSAIADQASVTGGFNPTGTVTFKLYNNPNGTGTPLFTDPGVPLVNGTATSTGHTVTATGTVYWVASYSGDSNNSPITSGTAVEPVVIDKTTPAINTSQQPATAIVGRTIADKATVTGGFHLTGTVTFNLYDNSNGTGTLLFTDADVPLVTGMATSTGYTTTATGTDYWVVTYNGDHNNNLITSDAAVEPVVITPATPAISTRPQPSRAIVGSTIADKATVTGGFNPTGTVTFKLYNNPNGTGTPLFTNANVPLVNGMATSTGYTTTATGTDYWVATYNGDSNNNRVTSGKALEPVVISLATPAITTRQEPATAIVGAAIADQANVTGGFNPTGTVTFKLYNNPNGTGTPLFTDTDPLLAGIARSKAYTTTATGIAYWVATYNGDSNNRPVTSGTAREPVVISKATPAISTSQQPDTATVGSSIADTATLMGGFNPTGTVTFKLYSNPNGSGRPLFTDTEALSGATATSKAHIATATGTFYWVATYNGDSNNRQVTSGPGVEPVVVDKATPAIHTSQQPPSAVVGSAIADQATVTGGFNPVGTVTFNLYDNPNGTGTPLFTDTELLSGGSATSRGDPTTATGTFYWVARYNGDSNNDSVSSGTSLEPVTITPATPAINTSQQPPSATVGSSITDTATVTGGFDPTGTVTFNLYNNPNGTGTPLFIDADVPLVNGKATSTGYTATATGTDYWVATYSGDSNNFLITSGSNLEPVTITPATPAVATSQQPSSAIVGSTIADQATVSGGFNPTGTVTFNLYDNPNGSGTLLFTDANVPLVNGTATSTGYTATATGTDFWVATYNGDSNNSAISSGTGLEPVTITSATPVITTSQQPPNATVGSAIADTASVSGGFNPTGTVTFNLYDNPNGTGTPLFTDTDVPLVNGMATSASYTAIASGTDYWVATYNGDINNHSVASGTGLEPVTITTVTPAITTSQQPPSAVVGSAIADRATVTGGFNPTGTVTFKLYNNPNGAGTPLFTDTESLSGGSATSRGYTATATGTNYWVATYNGDRNNNPITSGTAIEPVTIDPATPAIATSPQPPNANLGAAIRDRATVTGGFKPTGSVTFKLYDNPTATGTPLFTDTEPLSGGRATSNAYTTTATGTFFWVATYNGDASNLSVSSGPLDEPVVIARQANLALTKTPSASQVLVGMNVTYTYIIRNAGPDAATGVMVVDPLPPGLVFVSAATPSQGTYNSATGIWTVGMLANGASATLRVTARVMATGPIVNTARGSALEFDPILANNVASATVIGLNPAPVISKRLFLASAW